MRKHFSPKLRTAFILLVFTLLMAFVWANAAENKDAKKKPAAPGNPAEFAPESVTIDGIKKMFGPVTFTHKAHLGYAGDCATCHHHSPAGEYPACGQCHSGKEVKSADDRTIGLKSVYHRQCMDCHKTMGSGPMGCTDCHDKVKQPTTPAKDAKAEAKPAAAPKTGGQ
jgi:hypothetical protein